MAVSGNRLYDVIVIGAGIEGSSSAYNLAKRGKKVLLLEQFPLPHTRGSSHGQSRIATHPNKNSLYVHMMVHAFPMWATLEEEFGKKLFIQSGGLDLRQEGSPGCQRLVKALRTHDVVHEVISPKELQARFPMFQVGDNVGALFSPPGGILKADTALMAFQTIFQKLGGVLVDECPVTSVTPGAEVKVVTPKATYRAKSVVIAAGPWTNSLTSQLGLNLPLKPCKSTVFYWQAREGKWDMHHYTKMPCFIDTSVDDDQYLCYGVPIYEYPGLVKVCSHGGPPCDPDKRDQANTEDAEEKALKEVRRLLPWLQDKPALIEYGIVTKTPDNNPFVDRHPRYPNIVIAAGFSGYGFKLAPAIGKAVTELVLGSNPTYNMESMRLDRFEAKSKI